VNRGVCKYLTAPYDVNGRECTMLAIGCADMTLKTVITTVGITQAGTDSLRPRSKIENGVTKRYNVSVPRPLAIQEMFDSFSAIDVHDHLRQGSLAFHNHWPTKTYSLVPCLVSSLPMLFSCIDLITRQKLKYERENPLCSFISSVISWPWN